MAIPEKKIGLIINPVAGLGGRAGFKGSDNVQNQRQALAAGYQKTSAGRAADCLIHLQGIEGVMFLAPEGEMGGQVLTGLRLPWTAVGAPAEITTREDTLTVLRRMEALGADLIVFCGGDGTARDICEGCSDRIPVLGIPAGVKMYSGCFAVNPRTAGILLKDYVLGKHCTCQLREVMDLDEQHLGRFSVCGKLYGYLSVLNRGEGLQGAKTASATDPFETETLAAQIISEMQPGMLYIIGPGSTTFQIKNQLCGSGTLIGVDAVCNGRIVKADADEKALLRLLEQYPAARIIVTCIGGAGFLFGRGNQQISAPVIRRVGKENIRLAVTKSKLLSLNLRPMYVDTGDPKLDRDLSGYYRIALSSQESTVYRVQGI